MCLYGEHFLVCLYGGTEEVIIHIIVTMHGVVRHGRNLVLPVLLLGTHAARGRFDDTKCMIGLVAINYNQDTYTTIKYSSSSGSK